MTELELFQLAQAARPITDDDWGSDRQIEAENAFFDYVKTQLPVPLWDELEAYCLKATTDEMVDEALRLLGH